MNLKTSFFNKSLLRSDFKRFWWVTALDTIAVFFLFSFIYLNEILSDMYRPMTEASSYTMSRLYEIGNVSMPLVCIVPVGLAVMIFSYLNSSGAVACLHGLPIKRRTFFSSHILSGTLLLIIPVLVNVLIMLLFRIDPSVAESYPISYLFIWAGIYILYSLLVFAGTSFVCMISGSSIASLVFTYIFAILPAAAEEFIKFFCSQQLYGYVEDIQRPITEFLYITPRAMAGNPMNILKYIIFIAVFLAAAYLLYKKRKLENNGEVVAFPKLRPIFIYGVAVCAGAVGYLYFNSVWDTQNILLLLPFGIIGIIIADMIVKKSLKVKTVYKPVIIFCAAVCIIQLGFELDIFGYERRIPAADSIESAEFTSGVNAYTPNYTSNGKRVYYSDSKTGLTSAEDIDKVLRLHEELIKNRTKAPEDYDPSSFEAMISYNLKNGKKISRAYYVSYDTHEEWLKPIIETPEVKSEYLPILKDRQINIDSVNITDIRINGGTTFFENDKETADRIIEALRMDMQSVPYEEFAKRDREFTSIDITYTRPAKYADGTDVPENLRPVIYETYYVRESYQNTLALLNELGFFAQLPTVEDITGVGVVISSESGMVATESSVAIESTDTDYSRYITDREQISQIYESVFMHMPENGSNSIEFILADGYRFSFSYNPNAEGIPDILK